MDDVLRASLTVGSALNALRAGKTTPAVIAALDQAGAAVRDLTVTPYADALRGVLYEIERCARASRQNSPRLETAIQTAVTALAPTGRNHA